MGSIIDFHSHILPGIDDGSGSPEESMAMLQMEREQGIEHVVATPHFYPRYETPEEFLEKRDQAESLLRAAMGKSSGFPRISLGAEVYYFRGISESEFLPQLTIRGKQCILIEMPYAPWTKAMYRELEDIWRRREITPIIAHVDRYIGPFRTHQIPEYLEQMPVMVQANASFFLNKWTRPMALRLLHGERIHLLGSDCHNSATRPPNLGEALKVIEKYLGQSVLSQLQSWQERIFWDE